MQTILSVINDILGAIGAYDSSMSSLNQGRNDKMDAIVQGQDKIAEALQGLSGIATANDCNGCGTEVEEDPKQSPGDPDVHPQPLNLDFPTWEIYDEYKCNAANFIVDFHRETINRWNGLDVDGLASLGLSALSTAMGEAAILAGLALLGVTVSWPLVVIAGLTITLAKLALDPVVDFANILAEMDANRGDLLCALILADDPATAVSLYQAEIQGMSLTQPEKDLWAFMVTQNEMNFLYDEYDFIWNYEGSGTACDCQEVCADFEDEYVGGALEGMALQQIAGTTVMTLSTDASSANAGGSLRVDFPAKTDSITGKVFRDYGCKIPSGKMLTGAIKNFSNATTIRIRATVDGVVIYDQTVNPPSISWVWLTIDLRGYAGQTLDSVDYWMTEGPAGTVAGYWLLDALSLRDFGT